LELGKRGWLEDSWGHSRRQRAASDEKLVNIYARQDYEFQVVGDLSEIQIPFVRSEDPCVEARPNITSFESFQV